MRVIVTGSRTWRDEQIIRDVLLRLQAEHGLTLLVLHGDAEGADRIADEVCAELGIDRVKCPANWEGRKSIRNGRPVYWAGPWRNQFMLDFGKPVGLVVAFHPFIQNSKGTRDMVERAREAGVPVEIHSGRAVPEVVQS